MSWSLQYVSKEAFDAERPTYALADPTSEVIDQIDATRAAAKALIDSGAIGGSEKDFSISISGHANLGHVPASGWANDCVYLSITQKSPVPPDSVPDEPTPHTPATREEVRADG